MKTRPFIVSTGPGIVLAIVLVAAATAARLALSHYIGGVRFLPFFPAVIATSLIGGPVAGVVATALSSVIVSIVFTPASAWENVPGESLTLVMFVATGLMTVWLAHHVRRSRAETLSIDDSRLRLAAIVESSDDAIVSKSLDGVIRTWNAAAGRLFGYDADEIVGRSIGLLVPKDLVSEQASVVNRLRHGERVEPFETVRLHKSGTPVRVLATMSPLRAADGTVNGAVEITRDMSALVRIEAELRLANARAEQTVAQLRATIDGMSEGVVVADRDGNLLEWNRPALATHGFDSLDEVRQNLAIFPDRFELSDNGRVLPLDQWPMSRLLRGEVVSEVEVLVRRLDAPVELIINYNGRCVRDALGNVELAILTLHDVTVERRAQQAVQDHAERLSLALEAAGLGDWSWDAATDKIQLSQTAAAIFGVDPNDPPTRSAMRELLHESDRERARRASANAVEQHGDYDIEYRVVVGGRTTWVAAKGRCQYHADGRVKRMLGVVQDITARKTAEVSLRESREWLELSVSIAQTGTFRANLHDRTIDINEAGRTIYGFGPDEPLTTDAIDRRLHPADSAEVLARVHASWDPDGPRRFDVEHRIVRADGSVRWLRVRGRTQFEDAAGGPVPTQCVGTFLDFTDEKETTQQREHLLAAEQAARQQAEHASRMKDEFLATLSHELRTPLNAILGWSEILAAGGGSAEDVAQGIDVIRRNARSQAQIIEDLLDMSRIISGKVRLDVKPIDVIGLAHTAADTVRPAADAKGVRVTLDCRPVDDIVMADPGRMQQVVWNLLTNAIKFTPKGGEVRLAVRPLPACDAPDGCVEISVADSGLGITAEFLPYVFDRFRQADASTTRRHGGLGLGLAIVKQLVESHGGHVRVSSAGTGQGAVFTVMLPLTSPAETSPHAPPPAADEVRRPPAVLASVSGLRVLVVDDEPDARGLVKRLLEDRDAVVTSVGSAVEAMAALHVGPHPDVLVSDIGMPGEDGYALIARVRAAGMVMPAVALTAYAREEDRAKAISAGFQQHLVKPVNPAALVATIARAVGR